MNMINSNRIVIDDEEGFLFWLAGSEDGDRVIWWSCAHGPVAVGEMRCSSDEAEVQWAKALMKLRSLVARAIALGLVHSAGMRAVGVENSPSRRFDYYVKRTAKPLPNGWGL